MSLVSCTVNWVVASGLLVGAIPQAAAAPQGVSAAANGGLAEESGTDCAPGWAPAFGQDLNGPVAALAAFDDGTGPALYVAGNFTSAGGVPANGVARWDGMKWSALGDGFPFGVLTLAVFDSGSGPHLYAGGLLYSPDFTFIDYVAEWDGSTWLHGNAPDIVSSLSVVDLVSGPRLFATSDFLSDVYVSNGSGFSAVGLQLKVNGYPNTGHARAVASFDDGSGPALYIGGTFNTEGPDYFHSYVPYIVHLGTPSSPGITSPGGGMNEAVQCLTVFDDGSGPALYAGGPFTTAGGLPVNHIAKWDGTSWSALGTGMNGSVDALAAFDDGGGPALYAAGSFTSAGGVTANRIAKWNGTDWSALGSGMGASVAALASFDDGTGPALIAGGSFTNQADGGDSYLAKWAGCPAAPPAPWTDLGHALAGTANQLPHLVGTGALTPDAATQLDLTNAKPGSMTSLVAGITQIDAPFKGGVMVPNPDVVIWPLFVGAGGTHTLSFRWPAGAPAGLKYCFQHWVADASGPKGWSASNGLAAIGQ